ncbi:CRISPR-associated protein Cas4 [Methylobacillus flagellatus]|uniref:CRISPR-associated exonuclease Cas4 n=1 Tax=Methylobacillus flagellatus (strain ATCC 51484 / DSM 6875 / VKM B-1610 / KT) TaxID=265072 RepID=Q1H3R2_METFK|nr:CRISPR-associated protein Cas4 [Methylobacillus flagellatus]ABE48875.1 CRISPR-associated exonuclease, Cas4 family [Methylobacillus flagellatus KT]
MMVAEAKEMEVLTISALQHVAYCPRQFALIHVEQVWEENFFTAHGQVLHQRVDAGAAEQRGNVRSERAVSVYSTKLGLSGKLDLLEVDVSGENTRYFPVEYKRGKPKVEDWDRIQLCAQAMCLEEMRGIRITEGAMWYWQERKRQSVQIDQTLRDATVSAIKLAREILLSGRTPSPVKEKSRCKACSLNELCVPDAIRKDNSANYVEQMFHQGVHA